MTSKLVVCCLGLASLAMAEIIPAERRLDWTRASVGVSGGIPTNYTVFCNVRESIPGSALVAVGDGVADDTAALQAAITLCPNGSVVYIPAGTYRTTAQISRKGIYSYNYVDKPVSIVIRGDGPGRTRIVNYATSGSILSLAGGTSFMQPNYLDRVPKGATSVTLANATRYEPGAWVMLYMPNDTNVVLNPTPSYMSSCIGQIVRCVAKSGNTLTFDRPIYHELYASSSGKNTDGSTNVYVGRIWSPMYRSGIEDLTVERAVPSGTHNISLSGAMECWVKNVESVKATSWHIRIELSARCEVRRSVVHDTWNGGGNSGYGVGLYNRCSDTLVEDNIFYHCRHSMITEYGGMGNIFAYNYSRDPINEGQLNTDFIMADMCHHGGHPQFTLWEGNIAARASFDHVLGTSRYNTLFRNHIERITRLNKTITGRGIDVQRSNLDENVVGNVLGLPDQEVAVIDVTTYWTSGLWRLGFYGDGDTDCTTRDPAVEQTILRHGNYYPMLNEIAWDPALAERALPPSLYLAGRPAWWPATLPWPAIGPDVAGYYGKNPARLRWEGETSEPGPGEVDPPAPEVRPLPPTDVREAVPAS